MIKAVFFDLFNTLVHHDPSPEERHDWVCSECGIEAEKNDLLRGYWAAADFYSQENARWPYGKRSEKEKYALWVAYETTLLREAGLDISDELVIQILQKLRQIKSKVVLFDDTISTLISLHDLNLKIGVISNLDKSVEDFCPGLNLNSYLDFSITSHEVGFEKPHPEIFRAALELSKTRPSETIMVGDQYYSDITGARSVNIKPLLLDRDGFLGKYNDCQRITSLAEIMEHL